MHALMAIHTIDEGFEVLTAIIMKTSIFPDKAV
jgi:hypothetical protein